MSWELERAIETVLKAATRNRKNLYPNELKALQTITDYAQGQKVMQVQANVLFAKMLGIYIAHAIESGNDINFVLDTIRTHLTMRMEEICALISATHDSDFRNKLFASLGIVNAKTLEQVQQNEEIIHKNMHYIVQQLQKSCWSTEKTYQSLINQANSFILDEYVHDELRIKRQWELESLTPEQAKERIEEANRIWKELVKQSRTYD